MYVTLSHAPTNTAPAEPATSCKTVSNLNRPVRRLAVGASVYREGDEATHIYEVKTGILRLTRVLANGRRQVIAFALPGDVIGFPDGGNHHTDCDVLESCEVTAHPRAALDAGRRDPDTHERLLRAALREISAMQDHVMMLARKSALEAAKGNAKVILEAIVANCPGAQLTAYGIGAFRVVGENAAVQAKDAVIGNFDRWLRQVDIARHYA